MHVRCDSWMCYLYKIARPRRRGKAIWQCVVSIDGCQELRPICDFTTQCVSADGRKAGTKERDERIHGNTGANRPDRRDTDLIGHVELTVKDPAMPFVGG